MVLASPRGTTSGVKDDIAQNGFCLVCVTRRENYPLKFAIQMCLRKLRYGARMSSITGHEQNHHLLPCSREDMLSKALQSKRRA